jgi:hypothetical protein
MGFRSLTTAALLGATLSFAATAQPAALAGPVQILEALPQELGGFARIGQINDFETRPGGAGLGAALEFREPASGAIGTVYVFARGRKDLTDGTGNPAVEQELVTAGQEIERAAQTRNYTVSQRTRGADLPGGFPPPALRCDTYVLAFQSGNTNDSYACVGVLRGRFLKLRVSVPRRPGSEPAALLTRFGNAVLAAMRS